MRPPLMQPIVARLVDVIERAWRRAGYVQAEFPAIAVEALVEVAPHANVDGLAALAAVARGEDGDRFVGSHHSSQVIPLHHGPRFSIALNAWPDELCPAHCHTWCGAYQVLTGTSLSGSFTFTEHVAGDLAFGLGSLERTRWELLPPGSTVPVYRGRRMIHALSYVDRLGVSISVTTSANPPLLTSEYLRPGVRIAASPALDRHIEQQLAIVRGLYDVAPERAERLLTHLIRAADPRTCFQLLRYASAQLRAHLDVGRLFAASAATFGAHAHVVEAAIASRDRDDLLRQRRRDVTSADHRLLLTVLHLARTRGEVEAMLAALVAEPPASFISRCLQEMASSPGPRGTTLLGTPSSSDLHEVLALLLEDARTESVLQRLAHVYDPEDIRDLTPVVTQACAALRALPLLRPLFAGSG